jgi:C4-dicarboxylate transporter DctM subunit
VTTGILFALLFVFMAIGMPVAVALGLSSLLTIAFFAQDSLASLSLKLYETSEHFTLLAIPFFILGGTFMTTGGVAKRMIRFANACIGHLRGGLAMASVLACMLFAAVSGSSPATVVAVGSIVIAGMVKAGYSQNFAAGVICNAGTLGILIPPSIVMVVYGAATETSVGKLFMAGVVPGVVLGLLLMARSTSGPACSTCPSSPGVAARRGAGRPRIGLGADAHRHHPGRASTAAVFTPTEAAAVSAALRLLDRRVRVPRHGHEEVPRVLLDAGKVTVMLMFIVANALLFAHVLTTERIPQVIAEDHHRLGHAALAVPDGREHPAAGRRHVHGADRHHPHHGADPVSDRVPARHRPGAPRHHHGGEPRDRHGHSPGRPQPLRHRRDHGHVDHAGGAGRIAVDARAAGLPDARHLRSRHVAVAAGTNVLIRKRTS